MRLDRLITLSAVRPCRRLFAADRRDQCLPVLMYHSISADPEPDFSPYYKTCTSPERFAEQLGWLEEIGCRGVTLTEGLASLEDVAPPRAARPVAITFDDGFRDFRTAAFPALQRRGFSATMYLSSAFVGEGRRAFKSRECLTWNEVTELAASGIEFGSHTVSHPKLIELGREDILAELRDSRTEIEQRLGRQIQSFAYPYAFPRTEKEFCHVLHQLIQEAGYESAVTTMIGRVRPGDLDSFLPRLPVNSADDRALFVAKVTGAYDWVAGPQQLFKRTSRWLRRSARPKAVAPHSMASNQPLS